MIKNTAVLYIIQKSTNFFLNNLINIHKNVVFRLYGLIFLRMTKWWYQNDFIYGNSKYFNTHLQISKQLKEFGTFVSKQYTELCCLFMFDFYFQLRSKKIINGELIKNPVIALDTIIDNNTSEQEFNGSAITLHTAVSHT